MFDSVGELLQWQRIARREGAELVARHRVTGDGAQMAHTPIPGAELLCPTCSSEARPDDVDTATCGTCGTLSPLDSTVAFSNYVHETLHSGIRMRLAMFQGKGGAAIPHVSRPFPGLLVRVASMITLAAVAGFRRSQLDELLAGQRTILAKWVQREAEEGDRAFASQVPDDATGTEVAQAVFDHYLGPIPEGFPNDDSVSFALEQVFHAACQYYKFRTTSTYGAFLADGVAFALRARFDLGALEPIPWELASEFIHALDPDARRPRDTSRHRSTEEAVTAALVRYQTENLRLVRAAFSRHRVTAKLTV